MSAKIEIRKVESPAAAEIYISATPASGTSVQQQWEDIFTRIRDILSTNKASILHERIFGTQSALQAASKIRPEIYGNVVDDVEPTWLVGAESLSGPISGVQVQAVVCDSKPETIQIDEESCGRIINIKGQRYLTLSGITASKELSATEQAEIIMEKGQTILERFASNFKAVPRIWMWLGDILAWYEDFNYVRNKVFTECGILGKDGTQSMPASTGIGLGPADGSQCSMNLTAVLDSADSMQHLQATGKQQCALDYGSAFSRACKAPSPAGQTVFVSGTASIDTSGATTNIDDALGQITDTIVNVRTVLRQMQCSDEDVVGVTAYCKTTEVEKIFNDLKEKPAWPWVTVICDICRDDLLFEIEAAAIPRTLNIA